MSEYGLPFLFVAEQESLTGGRIGGPFLHICGICGLYIDCESVESAKITFLFHVARAHPWEYYEATGNLPTEDYMKHQEYLVREGFQ